MKYGPIGVKYLGCQKYPHIVIRAFAIRKVKLVYCYKAFAIRKVKLVYCYKAFAIRKVKLVYCYKAFAIRKVNFSLLLQSI